MKSNIDLTAVTLQLGDLADQLEKYWQAWVDKDSDGCAVLRPQIQNRIQNLSKDEAFLAIMKGALKSFHDDPGTNRSSRENNMAAYFKQVRRVLRRLDVNKRQIKSIVTMCQIATTVTPSRPLNTTEVHIFMTKQFALMEVGGATFLRHGLDDTAFGTLASGVFLIGAGGVCALMGAPALGAVALSAKTRALLTTIGDALTGLGGVAVVEGGKKVVANTHQHTQATNEARRRLESRLTWDLESYFETPRNEPPEHHTRGPGYDM